MPTPTAKVTLTLTPLELQIIVAALKMFKRVYSMIMRAQTMKEARPEILTDHPFSEDLRLTNSDARQLHGQTRELIQKIGLR